VTHDSTGSDAALHQNGQDGPLAGPPVPPPAQPRASRGDLHDVYERLRHDILDGSIAAGSMLNQVHIAKRLNVSRTPVREALRMLQAEGLVEVNFQHRIRVVPITPEEIDSVYAMWLLMACLGISLTVPRLDADDLARIRAALEAMNGSQPAGDWAHRHIEFHKLLIMHAGDHIVTAYENCRTNSERARKSFMGQQQPYSWLASEEEHSALVDAYAARDQDRAIQIMSRQLSRIALTVMGNIDPTYEPTAIRQAMKLVARPAGAGR